VQTWVDGDAPSYGWLLRSYVWLLLSRCGGDRYAGRRYHVAGSGGVFVAREPYKNSRGHVTRFLGLGTVGNTDKQKWLHALNLPPAASMPQPQLYSVPPGSTVSPKVEPFGALWIPAHRVSTRDNSNTGFDRGAPPY